MRDAVGQRGMAEGALDDDPALAQAVDKLSCRDAPIEPDDEEVRRRGQRRQAERLHASGEVLPRPREELDVVGGDLGVTQQRARGQRRHRVDVVRGVDLVERLDDLGVADRGAEPQPGNPQAFENVRVTTTWGCAIEPGRSELSENGK